MTHRTTCHWRLAASVLCSLALLVSCGGGVDSGGTGIQATELSAGPVSGLGSVIVNGVRFDDSNASIVDQDDRALTVDQLLPGMGLRIDASSVQNSNGTLTSTALAIRTTNELIGPIGVIDPSGSTLTVLGQTVRITAATWFHAALVGGLNAVRPGQVVEVFGQYNARLDQYIATRIALRPNAPAYEIRGPLTASDPTTHTLTVGGLVISDAGIDTGALPSLSLGKFVRVTLGTTPSANVWTALSVAPGNSPLPDRTDVRIAGRVSAWTSATQFVLNGISVDATAATFPAGSAGVVLGARVIVVGASTAGVLSANSVTVVGDETTANSTFEFHGAITALDTAAQTLTVRGITVNYSNSVQVTGGTVADLALGKTVAIVGTIDANRVSIDAQSIAF